MVDPIAQALLPAGMTVTRSPLSAVMIAPVAVAEGMSIIADV